jgi:hypothetical protein
MCIAKMNRLAFYVGVGAALVPATATLLIASSRIILVDIIANVVLRALTGNRLGIEIYGVSLIKVPLLWKISRISAAIGGSIIAFSLTAALINTIYTIYLRRFASRAKD